MTFLKADHITLIRYPIIILLLVTSYFPLWGVTNGSFESGTSLPNHWTLSSGAIGSWEAVDSKYGQSITITGSNTNDRSYWQSKPLLWKSNENFVLRFKARRFGPTQDGALISGPYFCNRDLREPAYNWTNYHSVISVPRLPDLKAPLRLGQWQTYGTVAFDDVTLHPADPVYANRDSLVLGNGENIDGVKYTFVAPYLKEAGNHARPLKDQSATFNTNRWIFSGEKQLLFKHYIYGHSQLHGDIKVSIGNYKSGRILVEASNDGQTFNSVGETQTSGTFRWELPEVVFPADTVWVRLRSIHTVSNSSNHRAGLQLTHYAYSSTTSSPEVSFYGRTHFVAHETIDTAITVSVVNLGKLIAGEKSAVKINIKSNTENQLNITAQINNLVDGKTDGSSAPITQKIYEGNTLMHIPYTLKHTGEQRLQIQLKGDVNYTLSTDVNIPILHANYHGARIRSNNTSLIAWVADSGWKVSETQAIPKAETNGLYLSAAQNEFEAIQLVIKAARPIANLEINLTDLINEFGEKIPKKFLELFGVGYVNIRSPSDKAGISDKWPDPLIPLESPIDINNRHNRPIWIRTFIPPKTNPGYYHGNVLVTSPTLVIKIPLTIEVYPFSLPKTMHCRSAIGLDFDTVAQYQNLKTNSEKRRVLDLYLKSFSTHRLSPIDPVPLDPYRVDWNNTLPTFDWSSWDRSIRKVLNDYNFNSFKIPFHGLGGGDNLRRKKPTLAGFPEDDIRYRKAFSAYAEGIESHLSEKGWLNHAFIYWFDEPRVNDYPFLRKGFQKLKDYAPSIPRLLTEPYTTELKGAPTIWCPLLSQYQPTNSSKSSLFWWYICSQPESPYIGIFIDRPGIDLRTWLWQTWHHGIAGILIWQSVYWNSMVAYPNSLQDPFRDPMSWASAHASLGKGMKKWGNGDGRLLYPPLSKQLTENKANIQGPIESIRWEMLRDGIEDYEYFHQLKSRVEKSTILPQCYVEHYSNLLKVPETITRSRVIYSIDPQPLREHRHTLAKAISELDSMSAGLLSTNCNRLQ